MASATRMAPATRTTGESLIVSPLCLQRYRLRCLLQSIYGALGETVVRFLRSKEHALNRPVESDCGDDERPWNDDALPVPRLSAERQSEQQERGENHRELSAFNAGVERQQRRNEFGTRKADLSQDARESHSVQEPETKDHDRTPGVQLRRKDVFDRNIDERQRNERLDHARRERDDAVNRQGERDRVCQRECRHLPEHRFQIDRQQKNAEDEEDVVESARQDVREAEAEIQRNDLPARQRNDRAVQRERRAGLAAVDPLRDGFAPPLAPQLKNEVAGDG